MDDFIFEIPNNISGEKCKEIIKRFEKDNRKHNGKTANPNPNRPAKKSVDLNISGYDEWRDIDNYLYTKLREGLEKYKLHLRKLAGNQDYLFHNINDSGYQIQRTNTGEYFSWHNDSEPRLGRTITYIWYLNTLDPIIDGGGTMFYGGKQVVPEEGKLLLFPATWTYIHAGLPYIGGDYKYVCAGWISAEIS